MLSDVQEAAHPHERRRTLRFLGKRIAAIREQLDDMADHMGALAEKECVLDPVDLADRLYRARRTREKAFAPGLFADPAWDIMLDLYVAYHDGREISVSSACIAAGVPATTGLRWLEKLEQDGLVRRRPDKQDGRRISVELTPDAERRMSDLLLRLAAVFVP